MPIGFICRISGYSLSLTQNLIKPGTRTEGVGLIAAWLHENIGCFEIASGIIL